MMALATDCCEMSVPQLPCLRALTPHMRKRIFTGRVLILTSPHPREASAWSSWRVILWGFLVQPITKYLYRGNGFKGRNFPTVPYQFGHCLTHTCRLGCLISCLITNRIAGINVAWKNSFNSAAAVFLYELLLFLFLGKACPVHNLSLPFPQYSLLSCAPSFQLFCQCPLWYCFHKAAAYYISCWHFWLFPMYLWSLFVLGDQCNGEVFFCTLVLLVMLWSLKSLDAFI